jgi:hypothetical protein
MTDGELTPAPLHEFRVEDDDLSFGPCCGELTQPGKESFEEAAVAGAPAA